MTVTPVVGHSTPLLHVADVSRSVRFYELLGFATVDAEGEGDRLDWARLHCEGGALMFLRASEPVRPSEQPILLYMYTADLEGLRRHLLAKGVQATPIRYPDYMPSGEMRLEDPDGFVLLIAHWGKAEHAAWEKKIATKKAPS